MKNISINNILMNHLAEKDNELKKQMMRTLKQNRLNALNK